jgi:hypothetical protein
VGRVIRGVAVHQYYRDEDEARQESERKARRKLLIKVNRETGLELAKQNTDFLEKVRQPLESKDLLGKPFLFRTTTEVLTASARLAEEADSRPIQPPPVVQGAPALAVRIHESLLNTGAARLYAGKTKTRADFEKDLSDLGVTRGSDQNGSTAASPAGNKEQTPDQPSEDFEITFAPTEPITAGFDNQLVKLTVRNVGFKRDGTAYNRPWQTTITYRLSKTAKGLRLDQQGEIAPVPLDPQTLQPTEMTGFRIAERRALIRLLQRNLKAEYTMDEIRPTGDLQKIGTLESTQAESSRGWLLLAWKRNPSGQ